MATLKIKFYTSGLDKEGVLVSANLIQVLSITPNELNRVAKYAPPSEGLHLYLHVPILAKKRTKILSISSLKRLASFETTWLFVSNDEQVSRIVGVGEVDLLELVNMLKVSYHNHSVINVGNLINLIKQRYADQK